MVPAEGAVDISPSALVIVQHRGPSTADDSVSPLVMPTQPPLRHRAGRLDYMAGNPERDDEADAQQVVTAITGVRLAHADRYGGADYRSVDGSVALEVTTVTDRAAKAARGPLLELIGSRSSSADLNECWLVSVNERHAPLKGVSERVLPHLVVLSSAGLRYVRRQSAYGFRNDAASVRDAVAELIRQGVELAASPTGKIGRAHV